MYSSRQRLSYKLDKSVISWASSGAVLACPTTTSPLGLFAGVPRQSPSQFAQGLLQAAVRTETASRCLRTRMQTMRVDRERGRCGIMKRQANEQTDIGSTQPRHFGMGRQHIKLDRPTNTEGGEAKLRGEGNEAVSPQTSCSSAGGREGKEAAAGQGPSADESTVTRLAKSSSIRGSGRVAPRPSSPLLHSHGFWPPPVSL